MKPGEAVFPDEECRYGRKKLDSVYGIGVSERVGERPMGRRRGDFDEFSGMLFKKESRNATFVAFARPTGVGVHDVFRESWTLGDNSGSNRSQIASPPFQIPDGVPVQLFVILAIVGFVV